MTGRGIDQILPFASDPHIFETYVHDARDYVGLAECVNGPIPRKAPFSYIWGEALEHFNEYKPDVKIINLETSITVSEEYEAFKGINYRMNPRNSECLTRAGIDCCVCANNHVLDWGISGLRETLQTLATAGIHVSGAGETLREARAGTSIAVSQNEKTVVYGFGSTTSGIPPDWAAGPEKPGVYLLTELSRTQARNEGERILGAAQSGDITVASVHWGGNWGYRIPRNQRDFARTLIDSGGLSVVHGHSSHHAKGMEIHNNALILYGCGDFINDYEGIAGYEEFRSDLTLMYFVYVDTAGQFEQCRMVPLKKKRFTLPRASREEAEWLARCIKREYSGAPANIELDNNGHIILTPA